MLPVRDVPLSQLLRCHTSLAPTLFEKHERFMKITWS